MGWLQNPGIINGLADGLTGGINAYGTAQKAKADAQQKQLEMQIKQRLADLQGKELEAKAQESQFKNFGTGLESVGGVVQPRADFLKPGMNYPETTAHYKRLEKEQPNTLGQAIKAQKAFRSGIIDPADANMAIPSGSFDEFLKTPKALATPEQSASYEKATGGRKLPPGISTQEAETLLARYGAQEQINKRQDKSLIQNKQISDRTFDLQQAKAIEDPEKAMAGLASGMSRMNAVLDQARKIKPSGFDYFALKAKAIGSSFDPTGAFPKLSTEESQRLAFYSGLTQDSIAKMFESGGKALTDTERRLSEELAISPKDSEQQIIAKVERLNEILKSKFDIEASPAERILPGISSKYRPKLEKAQSEIKSKIKSHAPEKEVSVKNKSGVVGTVPESQLQQAINEGYSLVK